MAVLNIDPMADLEVSPLAFGCNLIDLEPDDFIVERLRLLDKDFYRHHKHNGTTADLINLNDADLVEHFIRRGPLEKRVYNKTIATFLDSTFYINKHPELRLNDSSDALYHWLYQGAFQGMAPNQITSQLLDADIHLFQMGKVGSKSIEASIKASRPGTFVPHLHFSHEVLMTYPGCYYSYPEVLRLARSPVRFICGVRDPISRIVSGWIESSRSPYSSNTLDRIRELFTSAEGTTDAICKDLPVILNWFSHEFYSGIDVYSCPFDTESGFTVVQGPTHSALVYRVEDLDKIWDEISRFIGIDLRTIHVNKTEDKGGIASGLTAQFKDLRLSRSVIEEVFASKYCRHFYSSSQISRIIEQYID